jgi:hypothetical protein
MNRALPSIILFLAGTTALAQGYTREQLEEWFFDDSDVAAQTRQVNDGELNFLETPPDKQVHHHHNSLTITERSLVDGWVILHQCHSNIDQVGLAEVLFNRQRVRKLQVVEAANIEKAWVENGSVQLVNVGKDARLCILAESRALGRNTAGGYSLTSGPFMRKFLDGYYPMRVTLEVKLNTDKLRFASIEPAAQRGFKVWQGDDSVHVDTWFEGRLRTAIHFHSDQGVAAAGP